MEDDLGRQSIETRMHVAPSHRTGVVYVRDNGPEHRGEALTYCEGNTTDNSMAGKIVLLIAIKILSHELIALSALPCGVY